MQFVPAIPPNRVDVGRPEEPEAANAVQTVKPVVPRTVPPLVDQHRGVEQHIDASDEEIQEDLIERRREAADRRHVCRRVGHAPMSLDTRSEHDRRRDARRKQDHLCASVDIEA